MRDLADRLLETRKALGWNRERVAEFIGVDEFTILRYEKRKTFPQRKHMVKVNEFLNLFPASDIGPQAALSKASLQAVAEGELTKKIQLLTVKDRALIVKLVNRLLSEHEYKNPPATEKT